MPDATQLDLTYDFILRTFVERGQAPHFTEVGRAFGVSPDEGRRFLYELMAAGLPNWLFPSTDLIASFAPFNNVPTHCWPRPKTPDARLHHAQARQPGLAAGERVRGGGRAARSFRNHLF